LTHFCVLIVQSWLFFLSLSLFFFFYWYSLLRQLMIPILTMCLDQGRRPTGCTPEGYVLLLFFFIFKWISYKKISLALSLKNKAIISRFLNSSFSFLQMQRRENNVQSFDKLRQVSSIISLLIVDTKFPLKIDTFISLEDITSPVFYTLLILASNICKEPWDKHEPCSGSVIG